MADRETVRLIDKIKRAILQKLRALVRRCVVNSLSDGGMQLVNVETVSGKVDGEAEYFEQYGLTGKPPAKSEGLYLQVNGDPGHGAVICVSNRSTRPTGLKAGEVAVWNAAGQIIKLTATGIEIAAPATEALVKGTAFKTLYNAHTHASPTGPTGPPAVPMDVVPGTHTSLIAKTG